MSASVSLFDDNLAAQRHLDRRRVARAADSAQLRSARTSHSGVWSPDSADIVFNSRRKGRLDLYRKAARGAGGEEVSSPINSTRRRRAGRPIGSSFFTTPASPGPSSDVWVLPLSGTRKPYPFIDATPFQEGWGQFSPDGRWVAYSSDESGRTEIYVAPFPGPGAKWQISETGGNYPRWRRDGKELFYWSPDDQLMAATVRSDAVRMVVEEVRPLFQMRRPGGGTRSFYDVSRDGQRFLHSVPEDQNASTPLTLVTNWPALLRKGK